ncbi:hypothetical protein N7E81_18325 [Reichenbachiella carrageenanivorans]|uniref:Uncharacterized protein n=1 Tax=Reichenbachiella carrageenanivorans TaxID=2979869 RepID=A0ABY6CZH7_9BACT|nr:hypothetical protein [Reichenbachiella carrageenanivorans]UXX79312.1 hypothetical protein N7E81_18325 [Reichenbachiella carrageenanivorans]
MSESNDFLKFLINEDIYVIDGQNEEPPVVEAKEAPVVVEAEKAIEAPVAAKIIIPAKPTKPKHEVIILFDNPIAETLPAVDMAYLEKILGAIGLSTEKVDFLNVAKHAPSVSGYAYVIAFTPNHQLPVSVSTQQYVSVKLGDAQLIVADALNNISVSKDLRLKLWGVLQQVFK